MNEKRKINRIGRALLIAACVMALLTVSAFAANEATGGLVFDKITVVVNSMFSEILPNGDGSYTVRTKDGTDLQMTVNATDSSVTYEVTVDEDDVHSFSIQTEGAAAAELNP